MKATRRPAKGGAAALMAFLCPAADTPIDTAFFDEENKTMHMSDALLSPAVGLTMCAVSAGALAVSAARVQRSQLTSQKLPMMAVGGAFVFAAQMINFTIPGTGSSGHIGGGILLSALLGGGPALLALAAVLVIQCLFFADGGLLALGCNIFNMGVLPCLVVYPLVVRPILRRGLTPRRLSAAALLGAVLGLQLGAFGVVCNAMITNEAIRDIKSMVEIPVVFTVVSEHVDLDKRLAAGADIVNVSGAARTPEIVAEIRAKYPELPIIATGGPTDETILTAIRAGANAITYTPPSSKDLFARDMQEYRDWYEAHRREVDEMLNEE